MQFITDEKININSGILEEKKFMWLVAQGDLVLYLKENKDPDKFCLVYYCIQTGVKPIYEES